LKRELHEARLEIARLHAAEQDSIDSAMLAVFDAKDRIIQGAMERARQIEEQAHARAGIVADPGPIVHQESATTDATATPEPTGDPVADEPPADLPDTVGEPPSVIVQPTDILHKMLKEAESIRNRLDDGLASAFEQMDQMQRDAELRAAALLADARRDAARLRAAGSAGADAAIEVSLTDRDLPVERPSRYSRNSAGLPHIGEDGASLLSKMNTLRTKMREEDDAADAADAAAASTHDAAG
jgi:hypothetical protein